VYAVWTKVDPPDDDDCEIPPWVWIPAIAIPAVGGLALLSGIPIVLGALGLGGLGLLGLTCWLCHRPCDDCTCEGKCSNPDCECAKPDIGDAVVPPKTGDSNTLAVGALAMLALTSGVALILARKRREKENE